ncbi:sugar phosphate isomerase/epimerase family protein [Provencibacterium massiliense]|uniref:sugar phosphate isomerase/epimerase family protein n=1 Tax=Provencibacterium massiliense TaxID=1841868 RepID=UPI0009A8345F|nr:TIM barrel protein [Provencibacterium massiliense]RGB64223.1 sugar phosphate isomerase/epimerase [Harryflintia acetispora]
MPKINIERVAGMNICYHLFTTEYFLDSLCRLGMKSVEFWGGYPHQFISEKSYPPVKTIRRMIEERGLNLICYTPEQIQYYYNIAAREDDIREDSVEHFRRCIYAAAEMGAPKMLMTCGWGYQDEDREEAWKRSRESLHNLGEYAGKMGIILALENLQQVESNLIYTLPQLKKMLDELQCPAFKAIVDTVPMHLAGETMKDYIEAFGDDLVHTHLVDGNPTGHLAWGEGELPLDEDVQTLCDLSYKGTMSFEVCGGNNFDPEGEMKKSFTRIGPYLG